MSCVACKGTRWIKCVACRGKGLQAVTIKPYASRGVKVIGMKRSVRCPTCRGRAKVSCVACF